MIEHFYKGKLKDKTERIKLPVDSLYNLYMNESQILVIVEEKDPSTQIFSSIQFIEEEDPNERAGRLTLNSFRGEYQTVDEVNSDFYRSLRLMRNRVVIKNFHRCYFREYHYSRIDRKSNTLAYTNGPKDITVIPNLQFCGLFDQKNVSYFNVDVEKCISAICILDDERIAVLGDKGKIFIYNFEGNIEASFDGKQQRNLRENNTKKEMGSSDIRGLSIHSSKDSSFLVVSLNSESEKLNIIQILSLNNTVFSKSSLTFVDEWSGKGESVFQDVKFGSELKIDSIEKEYRAINLDQVIVAVYKRNPYKINIFYLNKKGKIELIDSVPANYGFADQVLFKKEEDEGVFVTGGFNDSVCLVNLADEALMDIF